MGTECRPWTVRAINLPEHATNPIHTDAGAQAGGFPRALVAGVTTYAYLTHPVVEAHPAWLRSGAGELRLLAPVFDDDEIVCTPITSVSVDGSDIIAAVVAGQQKATLRLVEPWSAADVTGESLLPIQVDLAAGGYGDYGTRAGDDLPCYPHVVHPAVWPSLANQVFHQQLVRGAWVHVRTRFQHHEMASAGDSVRVEAVVTRRFTKPSGDRAVALVRVTRDGMPLVTMEHEAIIALP
jgi:acyl dehydratase